MKCSHRFLSLAACLFFWGKFLFRAAASAAYGGETRGKAKRRKEAPVPEEKIVQSKHSLKIGGQEIKYTATAGTILLKLEDGTPKASIFYMAYTKDDVGDASQRPITFSFNGGPGSASVWLHLGLLGPRRVQMGDAGALVAGRSVQAQVAERSRTMPLRYIPLPLLEIAREPPRVRACALALAAEKLQRTTPCRWRRAG